MRYLNSFRPLCYNKLGQLAIKRYNLPPFIDASIRREPDFQSPYPSITALCRGAMFAPRLRVGDSVTYMTVKGRYEPEKFSHWRLVAILRVIQRFESHRQAATWYQDKDLPLPSNCMVEGNDPLPYDLTIGVIPPNRFGGGLNTAEITRKWDLGYKLRARKNGVFLTCEAGFLELNQPPVLTDETMMKIFRRIPPTLTSPSISENEYAALNTLVMKFSSCKPEQNHEL